MYVGEVIHPGFYKSYYDFIDFISFGTAVRTDVVYGFGIVRVIQTTSLFLLIGVFMSLRYLVKGNWWHIISLALVTFAICVTYTKSIWFGYFVGLLLYLVPCIFIKKEAENLPQNILNLIILIKARLNSIHYCRFEAVFL